MDYKKTAFYNAYVSKSNNGALVRSCFKKRWWWNLMEHDY